METIKIPEVLPRAQILRLPPEERESYLREIIKKTIEANPNGISVSQLAKDLPFDSRSIEKHLAIMLHTNEIYSVKIGNTNLYFPNTRALHPIAEAKFSINNREYKLYTLKNRLGEFVLIQEVRGLKQVGGGILIPLNGFRQFINKLSRAKIPTLDQAENDAQSKESP
jgi:hypothetical protein